MIEPDRLQFAI